MATNNSAPRFTLEDFEGKRAIQLLGMGVFPTDWALIPVAGKDTYVTGWTEKPMRRIDVEAAYKSKGVYQGLGVVTGELSHGLVAIDIDGHKADQRFRDKVGEEAYEALGQESTMSWTSGRPGRRQLLYKLPISLVPELKHVNMLILRKEDNEWFLGTADQQKIKGGAVDPEYEEVAIRFNRCQSVLPGSPHPVTSKNYYFLNYNEGEVADAPGWLLEAFRAFREPQVWLSDADWLALDANVGDTVVPTKQIRGWFFKEEVQSLLQPRLRELVFRHEIFDRYGWKERNGNKPQLMSGCPWHGGTSGTSFQVNAENGCWDCKACGVGGDVLDFVHKIQSNDLYATRPQGPDLEMYVAEIAEALGFQYPQDVQVQKREVIERPRVDLDSVAFFEALRQIRDEERNPAVAYDRMARLAADSGRSRLTGKDCDAALTEYLYKLDCDRQNSNANWFSQVQDMDFVIPNLLARPSQTIMHSAGGVGKTSAAMGLAKAVGTGATMRVRGIDVQVAQGPVLWIQSDQTLSKLKADLADHDINPFGKDPWFVLKTGFQINHMREFADWVREYKPALVVVDSIGSCSSRMQVSEIEKAFAAPLYWYSEGNGGLKSEDFPACAILWIHHDNANGEIRGNRYLVNAVDEQWHLRALKDEERDALREKGETPSSVRMIQIKKSRAGREGDLLKVTRDENFAFSVDDYTPTVRRLDAGQGDEDPFTVLLDIVKQASKDQRAAGKVIQVGLTAEEAWHELGGRLRGMQGDRVKVPGVKTVKRWLKRWVDNGMLEQGARTASLKKGQIPLIFRTRALPSISESFSPRTPELFQRSGSVCGQAEEGNGDCPHKTDENARYEIPEIVQEEEAAYGDSAAANADTLNFCPQKTPVIATVPETSGTNGAGAHITHEVQDRDLPETSENDQGGEGSEGEAAPLLEGEAEGGLPEAAGPGPGDLDTSGPGSGDGCGGLADTGHQPWENPYLPRVRPEPVVDMSRFVTDFGLNHLFRNWSV